MRFLIAMLLPFGWGQDLNRQTIEVFLAKLRVFEMPRFQELWDGTRGTNEEVPLAVRQTVDALNADVFGQPLFTVKMCPFCLASANLKDFEILIEPRLVNKIGADPLLLNFVIAHEMSHYIYELMVKSHGNKSFGQLVREGFHCTNERIRAHAAVDLIALVILEKRGFKRAGPRLAEFLNSLRFSCDGEFRAAALARY